MRRTAAVIGSAIFFVAAPSVAGGAHSVVDYALGISAAFLRSASDARCRDTVDRRAVYPGLLNSFARFALQGLGTPAPIAPTQTPRGDGSLSLRAQSYLRCRRRRHSGPSDPVRRLASHDLRRAHVARLPRLCPDVRGAGARSADFGASTRISGPTSRVGFRALTALAQASSDSACAHTLLLALELM